jgi:hypothetical protein
MDFPLHVGAVSIGSLAELGACAAADARTGGSIVPGRRVSEWVTAWVAEGLLDSATAVGLAAALIRHPDGAAIAEGARLARALADPRLGALVLHALDGHDTGVLLAPDPADRAQSVEDALLRAVAGIADLADPVVRERVLTRMRNAALRAEEAAVVARWGQAPPGV